MSTGTSTPLSNATDTTLAGSPTTELKDISVSFETLLKAQLLSASAVIEHIASRSTSSSSVYIYDLAEQAGFGALTQSWASAETAPVIKLQTRAGAGLTLVGRLSQGSSKDTATRAVLTAYNTPAGLAAMAHSLSYLPAPTADTRLVIQVPVVTPVGEGFALSPTLAPLNPLFSLFPDHFAVLLSATPQEAVDLAALSYKVADHHIVHLFDQFSAARELTNLTAPLLPSNLKHTTLGEGLVEAGYSFFDYVGDRDAERVVVLLNGPLAQIARTLAGRVQGLGVLIVRVLKPWNEEALKAILPPSVKTIHVLDDVPTEFAQGALYNDVFSSLLNPLEPGPHVKSERITPTQTQLFTADPTKFVSYLSSFLPTPSPNASLDIPSQKKLLFFSTPKSSLSPVPQLVKQTFASRPSIESHHLTDHDVLSKPGGITVDRLLLSAANPKESKLPVSVALPINRDSSGVSDFLAVLDPSLLKSHSVVTHAAPHSTLLVVTSWSPLELSANISPGNLDVIRERKLNVCIIDAADIASEVVPSEGSKRDAIQNVVALLSVLRLYLGKAATIGVTLKLATAALGATIHDISLVDLVPRVWERLVAVELPDEVSIEVPSDKATPLKHFEFNAISVETLDGETVVNGARIGSWHDAAKHILFPSAFTPPTVEEPTDEFPPNPSLRPEVPERTFLVTCTVNRRLTPEDYDRNVFHLEFDSTGTGLKYEIGEALGVHGWNDTQDVIDFCSWYGVDPHKVISLPIPGGDGTKMHTRTVFQALQQQVDLYGKPTKTFYSDLAPYATRQEDRYALLFIGSPEGSSTFKKLSEKDTVNFADVLLRYSTARPPIERLCEMIGDIKPRHYSIASAQAVVGDRVDLLVVSVDWVTPSGSPRYGQCTRYLAGLTVGQKVTVSIRPSVMKLPPDNTQPIIMAGLGTGAAPFRAFLQYRAWLASQNIPVGPTYYYFGSRHRHQEYLYGEEIEAYILDGTLTHAGLAFSRDQKHKIYIQNKMREDGQDLVRMLFRENGVFYLCGPTWPVPDVFEALVTALNEFEGLELEKAGAYLEDLKEEERYVLEVY